MRAAVPGWEGAAALTAPQRRKELEVQRERESLVVEEMKQQASGAELCGRREELSREQWRAEGDVKVMRRAGRNG